MKKITLFLFAVVISLYGFAQDKPRVAILDPTVSGVDEGVKVAVREIISSSIVKLGTHDIVERSLLEKVMKEQQFSNSGAVDESQATEIGKLAGASKVIVSIVTKISDEERMLSIKMIDVKTARIENQDYKVVEKQKLIKLVKPMALKVFKSKKPKESIISKIKQKIK